MHIQYIRLYAKINHYLQHDRLLGLLQNGTLQKSLLRLTARRTSVWHISLQKQINMFIGKMLWRMILKYRVRHLWPTLVYAQNAGVPEYVCHIRAACFGLPRVDECPSRSLSQSICGSEVISFHIVKISTKTWINIMILNTKLTAKVGYFAL